MKIDNEEFYGQLNSTRLASVGYVNLTYVLLGMLILHSYTGWGWALAIPQWLINILFTFAVLCNILMLCVGKKSANAILRSDASAAVIKEITAPRRYTLSRFVNHLLMVFFIWYFWTNDVIYTTIIIALGYVLANLHTILMRFYIKQGARKQ